MTWYAASIVCITLFSTCLQVSKGARTLFPSSSSGPQPSFQSLQPPSRGGSQPSFQVSQPPSRVMFPSQDHAFEPQEQASVASASTVNFPNTRQEKGAGSVMFPDMVNNKPVDVRVRQGKGFSFPGAANRATDIHLPGQETSESARAAAGLPDARNIIGALLGLRQGGIPIPFGHVNMTDISVATNRVTDELSKSLKMDVRAVSKALAVGGAAMGTMVFLGGMAAMIMSGLGYFNYPELYSVHPYSTTYGTAYGNQYRTAKALNENAAKKSPNPNLVPAINDLIGKLAKATQEFGSPK
ncbi:hypothetical protein IscW_ISCW005234 [Ixodes scapularis]|uniref:Uncharacterized protein n=1 Tax=Ixodes scapularis TaxID=6945 RepID=B7PEW7_IXOSC|nr:hypothetical protein IscW_ISCW005234 [Ixodes scapularis]|eukprot:XP_002433739.1 hypothetical protein IscW_ISCW005234 [Ixodes scapularis]